MTKSEILTALNEGRERFLEAIEDLTPDKMKETGVVGEWSVKDILVHLTRWEAELVSCSGRPARVKNQPQPNSPLYPWTN
jgi:hypothetical protein